MITFINNKVALLNQLPEIFLATSILVQLLFNLNIRNIDISKHYYLNQSVFIQTFFILVFTLILLFNCDYNATYNNFLLINTNGTNLLKKLIIFFSILALVPIANGFNLQKLSFFEYYTIYLFSILSSLLLISAGDFLSVYLLLEMQSLCFYILAIFRKNSIFSVEAGLKYFIFGSLISCVFLYALSLLYGCLGTLNFHDINLLLFSFPFPEEFAGINNMVVFSLALISIVLLFKIGVVPFHFWVADVYEGSPISSTIIFSFLPKIILFDLFIKISLIFGDAFKELSFLFLFVGLISILVGSLFALNQVRLKRFLIYSSISQMGFPILILSTNNINFYDSIYFFLILYTISSILIWSSYIILYQFSGKGSLIKDEHMIDTPLYLTDLSTILQYDAAWTFFYALVFFSVSGLPPLSGFLSKFLICYYLIVGDYFVVTIFLIIFSAISTFYYIRIIKIIFFESKDSKKSRFNYFFDKTDTLFKYNCFVAFFCLSLLIHAFFFMDAWLLFSKLLTSNILF